MSVGRSRVAILVTTVLVVCGPCFAICARRAAWSDVIPGIENPAFSLRVEAIVSGIPLGILPAIAREFLSLRPIACVNSLNSAAPGALVEKHPEVEISVIAVLPPPVYSSQA